MKKWEIIGLAVLCCIIVLNVMILREVKAIKHKVYYGNYIHDIYSNVKSIKSAVYYVDDIKSTVESIKRDVESIKRR